MYFNLPNLECDAIIHQAYFILQFFVLPGVLFVLGHQTYILSGQLCSLIS